MSKTRRLLAAASLSLAVTGAAWAQPTALSPEDLYEKIAPSVWLVETKDSGGKGSLGSAVVIAPTELITNCHVVDKAEAIAVSHGGPRIRARLRYKDPERDLCQLTAEGLAAPVVEIAPESSLRVGAKVYAIGNPSGMTLTLSDGLLSGLRRDRDGKLQAVQMTVPISPGSSGGGLFDVYGRLVGVVTFFLKDTQNLNFALPATWVAELPRRARGDFVARKPPAPPRPTPPEAAPAPKPAPVEPPVATSPPPPEPAAPRLAAGGVLEYRLRDRLTGRDQEVLYRLDRVDGDHLVFNQGSRVEVRGGDVARLKSAIAGEFEQAMPPGGWVSARTIGQSGWQDSYIALGDGRPFHMELKAEVQGEQTLSFKGQALRTVRVRFTGYTARGGGVTNNPPGSYVATAWYAPELERVVRFEARTRGGLGLTSFIVDEVLELVDIRTE